MVDEVLRRIELVEGSVQATEAQLETCEEHATTSVQLASDVANRVDEVQTDMVLKTDAISEHLTRLQGAIGNLHLQYGNEQSRINASEWNLEEEVERVVTRKLVQCENTVSGAVRAGLKQEVDNCIRESRLDRVKTDELRWERDVTTIKEDLRRLRHHFENGPDTECETSRGARTEPMPAPLYVAPAVQCELREFVRPSRVRTVSRPKIYNGKTRSCKSVGAILTDSRMVEVSRSTGSSEEGEGLGEAVTYAEVFSQPASEPIYRHLDAMGVVALTVCTGI